MLTLLCGSADLQGQDSFMETIDSLEAVLDTTESLDAQMTVLSDMLQVSLYNDLVVSRDVVDRYEQIALQSGDSVEIARAKNFWGMISYMTGDYIRAVEDYEVALEWYTSLRDTFMIGMMYNNLGAAYKFQDDRENAIRYFELALSYFTVIGDEDWMTNIQFNLAGQYIKIERLLEARSILLRVLSHYEENGQTSNILEVHLGLAQCYADLDGPETALPFLEEAEKYYELVDKTSQIRFHHLHCYVYTDLGRLSEAGFHCEEGRRLAVEFGGDVQRLNSYEMTYRYLKRTGDFEQALAVHEDWMQLNDSIMKNLKDEELVSVLTRYEVKDKEREIALKNTELASAERDKQILTLAFVLGLLALVIGVFFLRNKLKTNKLLESQKLVIQQSLEDKELLLREIHHRVKNNLQIVSSLLSLQSRDIKDETALAAVQESRNRVKAMALIHQNLYRGNDLKGIPAQDFVLRLANSLFSTYRIDKSRIELHTDIDDIALDVDTSIPLGLILNELITNCLKYAFPDERHGAVWVELKEDEKGLSMRVKDDGIGIAPDRREAGEDSFGMKMIKAFSKKLDADWEVISEEGTEVRMTVKEYKSTN